MNKNMFYGVFKRFLIIVFIIAQISAGICACSGTTANQKPEEEILELESRKCFDFFWNEANTDPGSLGYGLIRDRAPGAPDLCSIASVGFGLSAYIIGVESGWVTRKEAMKRVSAILGMFLKNLDQFNGFYYHFVNMNTGERDGNTEISVIDTSIFLCGCITAGEYFGGDIKTKASAIFERVDWSWFVDESTGHFYMGAYPNGTFYRHWETYAEQLMMYILGTGSPTYPIESDVYYKFTRNKGYYKGFPPYIASVNDSLFTYQYSHAWFDFRNLTDEAGAHWFENSVTATKVNRQFCIDNADKFRTLGPDAWGLTSCDRIDGYFGPNGACYAADGTLPPSGAAGSIVFTPEETIGALNNYYNNFPGLWGDYGFKDAFNLEGDTPWYGSDVIGIDKGITLLMLENYRSGLIWKYFMKNRYVKEGMKKLGFTKVKTLMLDDFDGHNVKGDWEADDPAYGISKENRASYDGKNSMRIDYDGESGNGQCVSYKFKQPLCVDQYHHLYFAAKGNIQLVVEMITAKCSFRKEFTIAREEEWQTVDWTLTDIESELTDVDRIEITVNPEKDDTRSTFYIDSVHFTN